MMEGTEMNEAPLREGTPSRVLRELIRTPLFRELLKLGLQVGPPGGGAELARTALREDVELALSIVGSSPRALNYLADFLLETLRQLSFFPAPVLRDFLHRMGEKVDRDKSAELAETASNLTRRLLWEDPVTAQALRRRLVEALNAALWRSSECLDRLLDTSSKVDTAASTDVQAAAEMVNSLLRVLARSHANLPRFLSEVTAFIDREAAREASDALIEAAAEVTPLFLAGIAGAFYRKYKPQVRIMSLTVVAIIFASLCRRSRRWISRLKGGR